MNLNALVEQYIALWNEHNSDRRKSLIAQTFHEDATYVDPLMQGQGTAGIDQMVQAVQHKYPDFRFVQTGQVDGHGDHIRFTWACGPAGLEPVVEGTDFASLSPDGRLQRVTGFLDRAPAPAAG